MTLVTTKRNGNSSFSDLFDELLNTGIGDWKRSNYSSTNTTLPKVNIRENDDRFMLEMAAPGMSKKDFNIELDQDLLTISSERNLDEVDENERFTKREFAYQSFSRSFTLPDTANTDKIGASYKNGILEVTIPKVEAAKPKPPKAISIS